MLVVAGVRDEFSDDELLITQEVLAKMLGVQRASISMFANELKKKGLIDYRRGRLQIVDAEGLGACACECHKTLRQHFDRLFGTGQDSAQTCR